MVSNSNYYKDRKKAYPICSSFKIPVIDLWIQNIATSNETKALQNRFRNCESEVIVGINPGIMQDSNLKKHCDCDNRISHEVHEKIYNLLNTTISMNRLAFNWS